MWYLCKGRNIPSLEPRLEEGVARGRVAGLSSPEFARLEAGNSLVIPWWPQLFESRGGVGRSAGRVRLNGVDGNAPHPYNRALSTGRRDECNRCTGEIGIAILCHWSIAPFALVGHGFLASDNGPHQRPHPDSTPLTECSHGQASQDGQGREGVKLFTSTLSS